MAFTFPTLWADKSDVNPVPVGQEATYWSAADVDIISASLVSALSASNALSASIDFVSGAFSTSLDTVSGAFSTSIATQGQAITDLSGFVVDLSGVFTTVSQSSVDAAFTATVALNSASDAITQASAAISSANAAFTQSSDAFSSASQSFYTSSLAFNSATVAMDSASAAFVTASAAQATATIAFNSSSAAQATATLAFNSATAAQNSATAAFNSATAAVGSASEAQATATLAFASSSEAQATATLAFNSASAAQSTATLAFNSASAAQSTATLAFSSASAAQSTASLAFDSASAAVGSASDALSTATLALNSASDAAATASSALALASMSAGGANLIRNSSFEVDTDANGVADGWTTLNASGDITASVISSGGMYGGKFQRLVWSTANAGAKGIGTNATVSVGSNVAGVLGGWRTGVPYVISWYTMATGIAASMSLSWSNGPQTSSVIHSPETSTSWQRWVYRVQWDVGATVPTNGALWISISGTGFAGTLDFDCVQVEEGEYETPYTPMTSEILPGTVGTNEIQAAAVTTEKIASNNIVSSHISSSTIQAGHISASAIQSQHISSSVILASHISSSVIQSQHISASSIQGSHISASTIQGSHISGSTIQGSHISGSTITGQHISSSAIQSSHISASSIQGSHIVAGTIQGSHISGATITGENISGSAITGQHISASAIQSSHVSASAIQGQHISASAIQSTHLSSSVIQSQHLSSSVVLSQHISGAQIQSTHLSSSVVQATHISASAIQSQHISSSVILSQHISGAQIRGTHISASTISGTHIASNTISGTHIASNTIQGRSLAIGATLFDKLYVKGTRADGDGGNYIEINGVDATNGAPSRGYNFRVFNRSTHAFITGASFDTYLSVEGPVSATLAASWLAVNAATSDRVVIAFSYDAIQTNQALSDQLQRLGASTACEITSSGYGFRIPYLLVGYAGLGAGNGVEVRGALSASDQPSFVETSVMWVDDEVQGTRGGFGNYTLISGGNIRAGTIQGTHISGATIQGQHISASTIQGSHISGSTITSDLIASRQVFAQHLALTNFDNNVPNANNTVTSSLIPGSYESASLAFVGAGGFGTTGWYRVLSYSGGNFHPTDLIPTIPGEQWVFSYRFSTSGTLTAPQTDIAYTSLLFYSSDRIAVLSQSIVQPDMSGAAFPGASKTVIVSGTVPANVTYIRPRIYANFAAADQASGRMLVGQMFLRRMNEASLIVDGAITTNKLSASAITGDKIAATAISSSHIAAGSVTARNLTIANFDNLWPNPTSELGPPSGATLTDPEWAWRVTGSAYSGQYSRGIPVDYYYNEALSTRAIPCGPGDQFVMSAWARATGTSWARGQLRITYLNSSGSTLQTTNSLNVTGSVTAPWTALSCSASAPANATSVVFSLVAYEDDDTEGGWVYFDNMYARRMADGKLIVDGSIVGRHISASSIQGSHIQAGTISASHLAANAIQTTNYTGSGTGVSEVAVSGAKLQSDGTSLLVAPGNLKIGGYNFKDLGIALGGFSVSVSGSTILSGTYKYCASVNYATAGFGYFSWPGAPSRAFTVQFDTSLWNPNVKHVSVSMFADSESPAGWQAYTAVYCGDHGFYGHVIGYKNYLGSWVDPAVVPRHRLQLMMFMMDLL